MNESQFWIAMSVLLGFFLLIFVVFSLKLLSDGNNWRCDKWETNAIEATCVQKSIIIK
jgi:hypothetical protein